MRALLIALVFLIAAPSAFAQTRYTLDPAHTQVGFTAERFGFNRVLGRFDMVSGAVVLDEARPENSSVTAEIAIASISTGNETRNGHLTGDRWLNAARFPAMTFRSTAVRITGERRAQVTGDLTLMGVTAPVTLDVTLNRTGADPATQRNAAGFSATGTLSRSAFGLLTAPQLIGDEIQIQIEALGFEDAR
ncbi:MAG: YceI family protein [Hyphomonadaceae bacterium]